MRILLKFTLDCDPDAAWRALHSPTALAELYGPLLQMQARGAEGMPSRLEDGARIPVDLRLAGVLPLGRQLIRPVDRYVEDSRGPVRILRDRGVPESGPLAVLTGWDHQMAVSPTNDGRTLWRERLTISGSAAPAVWPGLWTMWQWRARRLKALAPGWAYDPPATGDAE